MRVEPEHLKISSRMHLNTPAPVRERTPHLLRDRQCFCLAHFYQPPSAPSICSYPICSDWFRNGCNLGPPGLLTWSLRCWAEMGIYLGIPQHCRDNNSQAVVQSPHQPKACRQHFWKYAQAGGLHLLVRGWRSQGGWWPLSWQLQPRDVAEHDRCRYIPSPGSRCTVNKTVFPTDPAEEYILYSNEVIIKIGNYWNNRINSQSLKSS